MIEALIIFAFVFFMSFVALLVFGMCMVSHDSDEAAEKMLRDYEKELAKKYVNTLVVLAVLIVNGETFWVPCERGAVFCPHFDVKAETQDMVKNAKETDLLAVAYEPAPSTIVEGVNQ